MFIEGCSTETRQEAEAKYKFLRRTLIVYLWATLCLYLFGPIDWVIVAPWTLFLVGVCYLALQLGSAPKPLRIVHVKLGSWSSARPRRDGAGLLFSLLIVFAILSVKNVMLLGSPVPAPSTISTSYATIKEAEKGIQGFSYINFVLAPLLLLSVAYLLQTTRQKLINRFLISIAILLFIYSGLLLGSGSAFIEIVLLVSLVYLQRKRVNISSYIKICIMTVFVGLAIGGILRPRLEGLEKITMPIVPNKGIIDEFNIRDANAAEFSFYMMTRYITQGYQGLQLSQGTKPQAFWLPLTSSNFMERQYIKLGLLKENFKNLEVQNNEQSGWQNRARWSTTFIRLREDIPIFLLPAVCYILGLFLRNSAMLYLIEPRAFSLAQTMLLVRLVLFLPLNAIFLATGDELMRTVIFLLIPGAVFLSSYMKRMT